MTIGINKVNSIQNLKNSSQPDTELLKRHSFPKCFPQELKWDIHTKAVSRVTYLFDIILPKPSAVIFPESAELCRAKQPLNVGTSKFGAWNLDRQIKDPDLILRQPLLSGSTTAMMMGRHTLYFLHWSVFLGKTWPSFWIRLIATDKISSFLSYSPHPQTTWNITYDFSLLISFRWRENINILWINSHVESYSHRAEFNSFDYNLF